MSFVNDSLCEVAETDTLVSGESGLEEGLWIGAFLTCTSALHSHYTLSPPLSVFYARKSLPLFVFDAMGAVGVSDGAAFAAGGGGIR